jgi:hypothetical protein
MSINSGRCAFPGRPSGSGFLPDGRLLLAGALDK